jgi:DNA-binding transcriptional regulator YiaG
MKITKEQIKEMRQSLGETQEKFAARFPTSVRTLSRWENGNFAPLPVYELVFDKIQKELDAMHEQEVSAKSKT